MDTWNRLTDLRGQVGGGGDWKRLAKEHICVYARPMDTDNKVVKAVGAWVEEGKGEENGGHL